MELPSPQELEEMTKKEAQSSRNDHDEVSNDFLTTDKAPAAMLPNAHADATVPSTSFLPSLWSSKGSNRSNTRTSVPWNDPPPPLSSPGKSPNRNNAAATPAGPLDHWIQKAFFAFQSNPTTNKDKPRTQKDVTSIHDVAATEGTGMETMEPPFMDLINNDIGTIMGDDKQDSTAVHSQDIASLTPSRNASVVIFDHYGMNNDRNVVNTADVMRDAIPMSTGNEKLNDSNCVDPTTVDSKKVNHDFVGVSTSNASADENVVDVFPDNVKEQMSHVSQGGDISQSLTYEDAIVGSKIVDDVIVDASNDDDDHHDGVTDVVEISHQTSNSKMNQIAEGVNSSQHSTCQDPILGSKNADDFVADASNDDDAGGATDVIDLSPNNANEPMNHISDGVNLSQRSICQDPMLGSKNADDVVVDASNDDHAGGATDVIDLSPNNANEPMNHISDGVNLSQRSICQDPMLGSKNADDVVVDASNDDHAGGATDVIDLSPNNANEPMNHISDGVNLSQRSTCQDPIVGLKKADDALVDSCPDNANEQMNHISKGIDSLERPTCQDPIVGSKKADDVVVDSSCDVADVTDTVDASHDISNEQMNHISKGIDSSERSTCQDPIVGSKKADDVVVDASNDDAYATDVFDVSPDNSNEPINHISKGIDSSERSTYLDPLVGSKKADDVAVDASCDVASATDVIDVFPDNSNEQINHISKGIDSSERPTCQDPMVGSKKADDVVVDASNDDAYATDVIDVSPDNSNEQINHISKGIDSSERPTCQDPIVGSKKADDVVVDASCDVASATDVIDVSPDNSNEPINHISKGIDSSDRSTCQDPLVGSKKADDVVVDASNDDAYATDVIDVSADNANEQINHISKGIDSLERSTCQDPIVGSKKADDVVVDASNDVASATDVIDVSADNANEEGSQSIDDDGAADVADATDVIDVSSGNPNEQISHIFDEMDSSQHSTSQNPIFGSTGVDEDLVDASCDDACASDAVDASHDISNEQMNHNSDGVDISQSSTCQDPIVGSTESCAADAVNVSPDIYNDKMIQILDGNDAWQSSTCQDRIVGSTNLGDNTVDASCDNDGAFDVVDASPDICHVKMNHSSEEVDTSQTSPCQDPMVGSKIVGDIVVDVSSDNYHTKIKVTSGGVDMLSDSYCQDPKVSSTELDDDEVDQINHVSGVAGVVDISPDIVNEKLSQSNGSNGAIVVVDTSTIDAYSQVSGGVETSNDSPYQDSIVGSKKADDAILDANHDATDIAESTDSRTDTNGKVKHLSGGVEAPESSSSRCLKVSPTKVGDDSVARSVDHSDNAHERIIHKSGNSPSNNVETSAEANQVTKDVSSMDSGARSVPTPDRKHSLRNRFVNWRSKADAVLQNNQVFQLAQKNIEETNKKLQQVVENRNIGSLGARPGSYFRSPRKNASTEPVDRERNDHGDKMAPITTLDDDLSYDSTGGKSSMSDDSSEGSSVFADSSDEESSSLSDTSSVYANGFTTRRLNDNGSGRQRHISASMSSHPDTFTSMTAALPSTDLREDIAKNQIGVTPTKSNITRRSSNSSVLVNSSVPVNVLSTTSSPITSYKGRYEQSSLRGTNRDQVLQQIQRRVRSPSPVQSIDSTTAANDKAEQKFESQTSLLLKSIPASKMKELAETLDPGQYLMVLRPGMLGVNLKQTFLSGYGVYVDHILPGGNAEKSGVVCIGDSLVKVGSVDVSKGTIYDVPGIIAGAKRPAIIILNGEHEIEVEAMDYLAVAFGLANKIVHEATLGVTKTPTPDVPMDPESCFSVLADPPPEKLCTEVQNWSKRRNNSKAAFSVIKATFKQDQNLQMIFKRAFRICCLDNRRLPFLASFLTNDDAFEASVDRTDLVSASTSLMLYLEIVSFQSLYSFASRKRIADHARLIAHKFLLRNESNEPLFDLRPLFPDDLINDLQEKLNENSGDVNRALFKNIETYLENSLVGSKFTSFLLSDECARMRAYMRGTVPYIDPPLESIIRHVTPSASEVQVSACNIVRFMLVYLLCQKENDALDKNFDNKTGIASQEAKRSIGSAGGLSCSIFLLRTLQPLLNEASKTLQHYGEKEDDTNVIFNLVGALEDFWDFFVAPRGGILDSSSYSNETNDLIDLIREVLVKSVESCDISDRKEKLVAIVRFLLQDCQFSENLSRLRDDLLYDYHINHHSKYKAHIIHEWMCAEACQISEKKRCESITRKDGHDFTLSLRASSISRLFRKVDIPKGVSRHRPAHGMLDSVKIECQHECEKCNFNADFAIIFSARNYDAGSEANATEANSDFPVFDRLGFRRTVTAPVSEYGKNLSETLPLEQIFPVTMVSYAMIPPLKDRAFKKSVDFGRRIKNGWEVSLVNFMAPNANKNGNNQATQFLYGVTLVLNEIDYCSDKKEVTKAVAISLVAERNVIPAMRSSLMKLYEDKVLSKSHDRDCASFVSSLEKLEAESGSASALSVLLEPYLKMGSSPWIDQPLANQAKTFERSSLEFLVESLTPVPLSLLFLTALLEQKIVFTSQRRSALVSFTIAIQSLFHPMNWPHLIVPTVPPSLANDLVQYPAPFIIGIPLDNKESMDLLKTLPDDVTLVDIDAGRVILTKRFLHHSEASDKMNDQKLNSVALRSQVLLLAETLGNVFGVYQSDSVWRCDSPLNDSNVHVESSRKVEAVQKVARSFVHELTSGVNTCCYWIEEEVYPKEIKTEQNILFDEDRFLYLKELRSKDQYFSLFESEDLAIVGHDSSIKHAPILALRMEDFNLVIETFLRGQMMSSFVSSQDKRTMPFW